MRRSRLGSVAVVQVVLLVAAASGETRRDLPRVEKLLAELPGGGAQARADFARAGPSDPAQADAQWRALETVLAGDTRDEDGSHIRRELKKLPPQQWHFVILLDRERRAIYEELSGFLGLGSGAAGNLFETFRLAGKGHLCYERENTLLQRVKGAMGSSQFKGWTSMPVTANAGVTPPVLSGHAEHHAPCFAYSAPGGLVEIVADSWDGALVPAYTWWWQWDQPFHDALRQEGRDWCGASYARLSGDRAQRLAREKKDREERARRLSDFERKLSLTGPGGF